MGLNERDHYSVTESQSQARCRCHLAFFFSSLPFVLLATAWFAALRQELPGELQESPNFTLPQRVKKKTFSACVCLMSAVNRVSSSAMLRRVAQRSLGGFSVSMVRPGAIVLLAPTTTAAAVTRHDAIPGLQGIPRYQKRAYLAASPTRVQAVWRGKQT